MRTAVAHLFPQVILTAGAAVTLIVALFGPRRRQHWNAPLALLLLAGAAAAQLDLFGEATLTFERLWVLDSTTVIASVLILATTGVVVMLSPEWMGTDRRHGEYYTVLLLGALGSMAMAGAGDVNLLVVGAALSSVTGYTLAAYHRESAFSVEAGIKYFFVGAFANLVLLIGAVAVFAAGGTTLYADLAVPFASADPTLLIVAMTGVVVGLSFKVAAVPAHAWVPDVAQGAPLPSAAFLTVVPKLGGIVALARFLDLLPPQASGWQPAVALLAALTMTLGNLAALQQSDLRRLLGWSSVSQSGYALMGVAAVGATDLAVPAILIFLAAYAAGNLASFGAVGALRGRTRIEDYAGLVDQRPWLASGLVIGMLSLVGIPPTAGFAGKLALFAAAIDAGLGWLALVAVANTVISLAYYLRVVRPAMLGEASWRFGVLGPWSRTGATVAALTVVAAGLGSGFLLGWAKPLLLP